MGGSRGDFGVMLGLLWASGGAVNLLFAFSGSLWDHFRITLGALGRYFLRMKVVSGHFGAALGAL